MTHNNYAPWTREDEQRLIADLGKVPLPTLAQRLGRTPHAARVRLRKHRIGIRREAQRQQGMGPSELASALGVDGERITAWLRRGWITARRIHGGTARWRSIDLDDVSRFLAERGALLPYVQPIDPVWREEVEAARTALHARYITFQDVARLLGMAPGSRGYLTKAKGFPAPALVFPGALPNYYERAAVRAWLDAHPQYSTKAGREQL